MFVGYLLTPLFCGVKGKALFQKKLFLSRCFKVCPRNNLFLTPFKKGGKEKVSFFSLFSFKVFQVCPRNKTFLPPPAPGRNLFFLNFFCFRCFKRNAPARVPCFFAFVKCFFFKIYTPTYTYIYICPLYTAFYIYFIYNIYIP